MARFSIPTKAEVTEDNQLIFDNLEKGLGFVPNLYAYYATNETALGDYLTFQNRKSTLSKKEIEIVNLVVSQYNDCGYCLSAHTVVAGMNGFSSEEILEVRNNTTHKDSKLAALADFTLAVTKEKGKVSNQQKENFFAAGYSEANLIDVVLKIGDKVISNYIHNIADFAIDFPLAPQVEEASPAEVG